MSDRHDHDIVRTLRRLGQIEPSTETAERAIARTRARLAAAAHDVPAYTFASRFRNRWRRWSLVPVVGLAAALVLMGLLGTVHRPAMALSDVLKALNSPQSIRYTTFVDRGQGPVEFSRTTIWQRHLVRMEYADGHIYIVDRTLGKSLTLYPDKQKAVVRSDAVARRDIFDVLDTLENQPRVVGMLPEQLIDGVPAVGFLLTSDTGESNVWVAARSRLLVRWESSVAAHGTRTKYVHADFEYGAPVDTALLELTPPAGYEIERQGVPELRPLAEQTLQSPTLFVGRGVGPVQFGMSREEVSERFGPPEEIDETLQAFRYPSRGLDLLIGPRLGLWGVICRTQDVAPERIRDFSGQTDAGIGMGASAEDIIAAYGPPDERVIGNTGETLTYKSLHLSFSLAHDRLVFLQHDAATVRSPASK